MKPADPSKAAPAYLPPWKRKAALAAAQAGAETTPSAPGPTKAVDSFEATSPAALAVTSPRASLDVPFTVRQDRPSQIRPDLFLGSFSQASSQALLRQLGVTDIINVTIEQENCFPQDFNYLRIPVRDREAERLAPFFAEAQALYAATRAKGGKLLVHCQHGISRSATIVVALLMTTEGLSCAEALEAVKAARSVIEPNAAFLRELEELGRPASAAPLRPAPEALEHAVANYVAGWAAGLNTRPGVLDPSGLRQLTSELTPEERASTVAKVVRLTFGDFAGTSSRDRQARLGLAAWLKDAVSHRALSPAEVRGALRLLTDDETWEDYKLDVPHADLMLRELQANLQDGSQT